MPGFISEERLTYGPWEALERAVARFVGHGGFNDVQLVGGSGDKGADVVATKAKERWVFQAKYRKDGGVGSDGAREAVMALSAYKADAAVAIANTYFYEDALKYQKDAERNGLRLNLWNGGNLLEFYDRMPRIAKNYRQPRNYQEAAVDAVENSRSMGHKKSLIVMATGLGKSMVANTLIANELMRNPDQEVLVLAHVTDLVRQLEISSWTQLDKTHSTHLWTDGERPAYSGGVVFATWQSVFSALRRGENLEGRFGLIVVDEAHHAPSTGYSQLLEALSPNFLVGLTATPWRGDDVLLDDVFGPPCYSMDIVEGMQKGYLAQVDYRMLTDGIDWKEITRLSRQGLTVKDLNRHLLMPERDVAMVNKISGEMRQMTNPRALAFCRSIAHAETLRPLFSNKGIRTAVLHSKLSRQERFDNLASFRMGEIDLLISIEMLNEGIDVPDVNLVAFMRVTHSRRIFLQQLGRGLRISQSKASVLVLDFVADIRRIAAGLSINEAAISHATKEPEFVKYHRDGIVTFDDVSAKTFFDDYLADVADLENYEDGARLRFPDGEVF